MKGLFGTDAKCRHRDQRAEGDRMVADAERKVDDLQHLLDERPPRNLDEAIYGMTRRRGE